MDSQGARRSTGGLPGRPQEPGWTLRAPTGARVDSQGAHRSPGGLSGRPQEPGWTLRAPTGSRVDSQGARRSPGGLSGRPQERRGCLLPTRPMLPLLSRCEEERGAAVTS